ncbi:hypothetical protein QJS83_12640 [Bdellovibrio sp. 22V]|uniref:hypothetical protein n=1 Tax=Bdellovibrio TaxID=958 RepID=UPI002543A0B8|nr:hypothetical protein [Bdellovibrio sp. 22V]WII71310.1 hypothetical protein QJS83_12640 [Bdellovibrio sp. 22V]
MKSLILAALLTLSFAAQAEPKIKGTPDRDNKTTCDAFGCTDEDTTDVISKKKDKGEPAPKDRDERGNGNEEVDPRQETYEGNDRGGGSFDGGGYEGDGGGGGMIGEIFYVPGSAHQPVTTTSTREDRGDVIVYTIITRQAVSPTELCTTTTVTTVHKTTEKVISSNTDTYCLNF